MSRLLTLLLAVGLASVSTTALAQTAVEGRVDRLEHEMRAVQRKVFPAGSGQYFQPEIAPADTAGVVPGTPATSPVTDLSGRVSSLESQMTTLTGQVEQSEFKLRQLEAAFDAYKRGTDLRLSTLEGSPSAGSVGSIGGSAPVQLAQQPAPGRIARPSPIETRPVTAPIAKPVADPARAKALAAIERPTTGDPAEDGYSYGYRLWQAKLYPEAEAALKDVVAKYPRTKRASYAQNLLGRAYLDEERPSLASIAFYDNYKKMPEGDRAPESLYYLAAALMKLNKPADACKVYGELSDVYAAKITPQMKTNIAKGRAAASCK